MELITVFMILLLAFVVQGASVERPQNTVVTAGSNVTIKCSSDRRGCNGVEWAKIVRNTAELIYKNTILNKFNQTYHVDNSSGCNLVITDVQLDDAGRFLCTFVMKQQTQERSATLIVLKSEPKCRVNVSQDNMAAEGDSVSLTCEAMFNGIHMTSVIWEGLEDITPVEQHGNSVNYSYSIAARAPLVPAYTCVISFIVTKFDNVSAINIPVTNCATPNRTVLYAARNVTLNSSLTPLIYPSESLIICSADGNPSPTYKWQQLREEEGTNSTWTDVRDGSEFFSTNTTAQYRCAANNAVKGVNYSAYSNAFRFTSTGEATTGEAATPFVSSTGGGNNELDWLTLGIAGVASIGVLLLLILITICFCTRPCPGYKCCHSDKKSIDNSRTNDIQIQPMQETVYSNVNNGNKSFSKSANPRPLPSQLDDPPKRPQVAAPPQPKPGKSGQNNKNDEPDELTYACLAGEQDPRIHRNVPNLIQECEYAGIGSA